MKVVYCFCVNPTKDRVGPAAFEACRQLLPLQQTDVRCDGMPVYHHQDGHGNELFYLPTEEVVTERLSHYLPILLNDFADAEVVGVVNWHEGRNAPDQIFCVHTTGDVPTGMFGSADPALTTAVARALDLARQHAGLNSWAVLPEATHFAGTQCGEDLKEMGACPLPLIDIEIGSNVANWSNETAIAALARGLAGIGDAFQPTLSPILWVGGVHFEPSLREGVFGAPGNVAFGHVLPNQWLGAYPEESGLAKLRAAVQATKGGIRAVVFHDSLKGPVKDLVRALASEVGVPALKHKRVRDGLTGACA